MFRTQVGKLGLGLCLQYDRNCKQISYQVMAWKISASYKMNDVDKPHCYLPDIQHLPYTVKKSGKNKSSAIRI